jgi:O-antigen ligase
MIVYYIIIFLLSFMQDDFNNIVLFYIGTFKVYLIDIVYTLIMFSFLNVVLNKNRRPKTDEYLPYMLFLVWLVFGILYGFSENGLRALGEGRVIIYGLFAFFVPFYLPIERTPENITKVFVYTLIAAGIGASSMFVVEILNDGRFFFSESMRFEYGQMEDFRGIRILSTEHTYSLGACVFLIYYSFKSFRKLQLQHFIVLIVLLGMIVISMNRTATIALAGIFIVVMLQNKNIKVIIGIVVVIAIILFGIANIMPDRVENIKQSFTNMTDISSDASGNWRLLVQKSALEQALESPIIGQGYGGYFNLYIPELNIIEKAPPHSEYVYLFLKSGIIGVLLVVIPIVAICRRLLRLRKLNYTMIGGVDVLNLLFVLLASQLIYGLAYNFTLFYGIYYGFAVLLVTSLAEQSEKTIQNEMV